MRRRRTGPSTGASTRSSLACVARQCGQKGFRYSTIVSSRGGGGFGATSTGAGAPTASAPPAPGGGFEPGAEREGPSGAHGEFSGSDGGDVGATSPMVGG